MNRGMEGGEGRSDRRLRMEGGGGGAWSQLHGGGGGSSSGNNRHQRPSSDANGWRGTMGSPSVGGGGGQEGKPPEDVGSAAAERDGCLVREQDRFMPIANVIRIMRRILPSHAKISDDAKETIQECVSEYISFVTSEANERCQREQRKTITADDVLWAMRKLGFDDYVEPLSVYLQKFREMEGERGGMRVVEALTGSMRKDMGGLNGYHSSTHHGMYGVGGGRFYRDGGRGGGAPPPAAGGGGGGGGSLY